jgi:queuosine precursor transporter
MNQFTETGASALDGATDGETKGSGAAGFPKKNFLPVISGLFVGILVLSNILASKMVQLGPFVFDGGTLLFPLSYIFGDVLTEVYGYKESRKVIWTGLVSLVLMAVVIWIIGLLPAEPTWTLQKDYDNILMMMPRIVLASVIAYFAGEYSNSVILSRLKILTNGRRLWTRTIGSTLIGELIDSALFVFIAFTGLYPVEILIVMAFSNYLFKSAIEVAFTPATYFVVNTVKQAEKTDAFDYDERYNPLPTD